MEKISEALKSTNAKRQNLREAYDLVQSHSCSLNSFTLQWSDVEQYFDTLQNSLEQRFKELQTKEKQSPPMQQQETAIRSELKSFCVKMDGPGLRCFIMEHRKDLPTSCEDATYALNFAPDPAKLVLDALQGFYPLRSKRDKAGELGAIRRTCALLLEGLTNINPEINPPVKMEAKKLAVDWKHKVSMESDDQLEALVFLQLLGSYGLAEEFNVDELLDLLVSIARRRQAVDLFKGLGFQDKISDFIQRLCSKGKQIDAVKFAYAFDVVDKFPPVPLLKEYLEESKKVAEEVRKRGTNPAQIQNEARAKETSYLKAIIKCIDDHKLEVYTDRNVVAQLVRRAERAGFKAIALTVDTPRLGCREADIKNRFTLPPHLTLKNFEGLDLGKMDKSNDSGLASYVAGQIDRTLEWKWLQTITKLPILVKGVMTAEDAVCETLTPLRRGGGLPIIRCIKYLQYQHKEHVKNLKSRSSCDLLEKHVGTYILRRCVL